MRIERNTIIDDLGRQLLLRGCNLGGDSKYPVHPNGATWNRVSLSSPETVSFTGRPFPVEEADLHFSRLRDWGFFFVRFLITWEAVEHSGPGIYDESYLAYVRKILKKAEEYGISVFIDPHQDVWSRWTGGDGAPAWTLEKLGMDLQRLYATGAALTHQEHGDPFPNMIWTTNYNRYAAATMFTLFFAGNTYAPETQIEGQSAQDWLQERYIAAMRHSFRRLKDCKAIVGWGTMNEPHAGFIGYNDLSKLENCTLKLGPVPSAFQSMAAATGRPTAVPVYKPGIFGTKQIGTELINPAGLPLYKEGFECPWKKAGVWDLVDGEPTLLKPDYFNLLQGRKAVFVDDFLKPFMKRFADTMHEARKEMLIFIEGIPNGEHPTWSANDGEGFINAFHWYDGATLVSRKFRPGISIRADSRKLVLGKKAVARSFSDQLADDLAWAQKNMQGMPCILGEFGLPFDLGKRKAFCTGDYAVHEKALDLYYTAIDELFLHATIWNYTASNSHEHGDGWNGEDLSIFSTDGGERAIAGWLRPYPIATAGTPVSFSWDRHNASLEYHFVANPAISAPTEIFLPKAIFENTPEILLAGPNAQEIETISVDYSAATNRVSITNDGYTGEMEIRIRAS